MPLVGLEAKSSTLQMINSQEIKTIRELEQTYPELWLFIEVTREDIHYVYEGKLVAVAEDPMEFVDIGKDYRRRNIVNLTTRGDSLNPDVAIIVG